MVNRSRRQQRRRQRGGFNASLDQGQVYQNHHATQHGGSRALEGAPLDYTGVLDSSLRAGARLEQYDAHFRTAQAQSGGSRRRRNKSCKKSRNNRQRRQRGGALSPADANASYTLLPSYDGAGVPPPPAQGALVPYTVVGGDRLSPASMKGGRRKSQKNKSRKNNSRKNNSQNNRRNKSRRQRGGFSPVGQPSMLLSNSEYDKAGLHAEFKNPLLLK